MSSRWDSLATLMDRVLDLFFPSLKLRLSTVGSSPIQPPQKTWSSDTDGSEFSPSLDVFHPPYPPSSDHLLSVGEQRIPKDRSTIKGQKQLEDEVKAPGHVTCFDRLPGELIDHIFSYLSVPTLDAARFVCKTWWTRILTNPVLLSAVLRKSPSTDLRRLLADFDEATGMAMTDSHPDTWRTRFRAHTIRLMLADPNPDKPPGCDMSSDTITSVARTAIGDFLLVHVARPSQVDRQSTVLFYHFDDDDTPVYVGYAVYPVSVGEFTVTSIAEVESRRAWIIGTCVGSRQQTYGLVVRDCCAGGESPYTIKVMGPANYKREDSWLYQSPAAVTRPPQTTANNLEDSNNWSVLERIPLRDGRDYPDSFALHTGCNSDSPGPRSRRESSVSAHNLPKDQEQYFVAEDRATGELHIVEGERSPRYSRTTTRGVCCSPPISGWQWLYHSIALLSSPRAGAVYHNVTVSPPAEGDRPFRTGALYGLIIRIAVVWQGNNLAADTCRELFIYEVPTSLFANRAEPGLSAEIPKIQGNRISSLVPLSGGIHPKSSHSRQAHEIHPSFACLGGIAFPQRPGISKFRKVDYAKLFVWGPLSGPNARITAIDIQVFDFHYANP
ncbi:MAG: hypothetical protein Q9163_006260, partial [Psora crenata]